jgi:hypothetical protein
LLSIINQDEVFMSFFDCVETGVNFAFDVAGVITEVAGEIVSIAKENPKTTMVIGTVALGALSFGSAPAIGALVSRIGFGVAGGTLKGAAASKAGLAFLGGGSIASGGAGVVGGTVVVTGTGSVVGGGASYALSKRRALV